MPITKQYQILNHHTDYDNDDSGGGDGDDDNQNAGIDNNVIGASSSSSATSTNRTSSNEYIPNAPNSVTYTIYGYQQSKLRTIFYHVISILFFCIPYLIAHISTSFLVWLKWKKVNLDECDFVLG